MYVRRVDVVTEEPNVHDLAMTPANDDLAEKEAETCGTLLFIDLHGGDIVHWVHFDGVVDELYTIIW